MGDGYIYFYFSLFFIFQLETGVGAGGLLLNRQFPPPLTIEHGPDITKEKKNHAKSAEHAFEGTRGLRQKVWTWTKILSLIIRYYATN